MTIATRLDRLMQARRLKSQSALARLAGVPQPTINRILKGQTDTPELGTVKKIAAALNVPATWLAEGPSDDPPVTLHGELEATPFATVEERVRRAQIEALHELIDALPGVAITQLLAFVQQATQTGEFRPFAQSVITANYDDLIAEQAKEIRGGEPDEPVHTSNRRVKTR